MMALLALIGFIVVVRLIYQHIAAYQKLKTENACLRRYWKDGIKKSKASDGVALIDGH